MRAVFGRVEPHAQRNGAGGVRKGGLAGEEGIEGAQQIELPGVIGRGSIAKGKEFELHREMIKRRTKKSKGAKGTTK